MITPNGNEGRTRAAVKPGCTVDIVQKEDQRCGEKTCGVVKEILTPLPNAFSWYKSATN
ncbi:MAG: DUF2196 domain-containing protein [Methanomicrobiales archaeon]